MRVSFRLIDLPPGAAEQLFGPDRDPQDIADERFWFAHELRASDQWVPDLPMLRRSAARIVVGVGAGSAGQACDLTAAALATQLGIERATFPGDHTGFVHDPDGFANQLREIL